LTRAVLSTEEIEALLEGYDVASPKASHSDGQAEELLLTRLTNHPWSALDAIHKQYAALLATCLTQQSGRPIVVVSHPSEVLAHGHLLGRLAATHVVGTAVLNGSGCRVLAVLNEEGVQRFADLLFGGSGSSLNIRTAGLSPVEQVVARDLMNDAIKVYADAHDCARETGDILDFDHREGEAERFAPAWERLASSQFQIVAESLLVNLVIATPIEQVVHLAGMAAFGFRANRNTGIWPMHEQDVFSGSHQNLRFTYQPAQAVPTRSRISEVQRCTISKGPVKSGRVSKLVWIGPET
jgi:flagellar motor switch protein FliM